MIMSLPVENQDTLKTIQGFLKKLLESGAVEALLVPMRTPSNTITPALVTNPELLAHADPLAPVMAVNQAALAGKLSAKEPRARVGVVLRSCELRALVELTKLQQASLDSLLLIAVDCAGTYAVTVYQKMTADGGRQTAESGPAAVDGQRSTALWQELYKAADTQPASPDPALRVACKICEQPVFSPRPGDVSIHLLGGDLGQAVQVSLPDDLAAKLELQPAGPDAAARRAQALERLVAARTAARDAELAAIRSRLEGKEGLAGIFAACIRCHNCMTVCPICYCKTCVFKSAIFDHEPMQFVSWARQKGAFRMPADTTLFHMTRLNHMSLSCIGCGMCTEACPSELPVGLVFRAIGQRVQAAFEYQPGRSLDDPLPLVTFKADEWTEVGE